MFLDTFSCVFKKEYFFLHLALHAHVTVFSGAGLWKRVPEWRFMTTPDFRFHVEGRKRIFEYKMSYIFNTAHALYVREAIVFGYIYFRVFVFMDKNDLTRLCVHLCVLFLKKKKKKSVHFQKNNNKPDTSGWGLSLSCETCVVINSYGGDWSREIVKPNLWRNSAFSDQ